MSAHDFIQAAIVAQLPDATVTVSSDDAVHFQVQVVSEAFKGLPLVQQHRLVHQALGHDWATKIHAIALTTQTPTQEK